MEQGTGPEKPGQDTHAKTSEAHDSSWLASSSMHSTWARLGQKHRLRVEKVEMQSQAIGDFHLRPLVRSCRELQ